MTLLTRILSLLAPEPRGARKSAAKAHSERLAAFERLQDARRRRDTRDIHSATAALQRATTAVLEARR